MPTARTRLTRLPQRGSHDHETIAAILDQGLLCHLGLLVDGQVRVVPTGYGRDGDLLYVHGSAASRSLRAAGAGIDVCLTVTLLDGLVLARSAFHHSMNYRSVVVYGTAREVASPEEKLAALRTITEHLAPGRWDATRQPAPQEVAATTVLALPWTEASAKVRTGPPVDDAEDYALDVWAGVLPLRLAASEPAPDPALPPDTAVPAHVRALAGRVERGNRATS